MKESKEKKDPDMKDSVVKGLNFCGSAGEMGNKLEIGGSAAARISERGVRGGGV